MTETTLYGKNDEEGDIMRRNTSYAVYNNKEYRIIDENWRKIMLVSFDPDDLKDGFKLDDEYPQEGTFVKWVARKKITTTFGINTFCRYQGHQFGYIKADKDKCLILGGDENLCKKLQFEMIDRAVYEKWVKQDELEWIWEVRSPSQGIPALSECMRNGKYCVYEGNEYQFERGPNGLGVELLAEDREDQKKGFSKSVDYKVFFTKFVEFSEVTAYYYLITLCRYKNHEFQVMRKNGSQILIHTNYYHVYDELRPQIFQPEEGVYEAWIEKSEAGNLWEEQMPYEE
jgi:hypothetical protein